MAKKVKYPEMLVAEIRMQESKLSTLLAQYKANEAKIARLQQANVDIKKKHSALKATLEANKSRALTHNIPF